MIRQTMVAAPELQKVSQDATHEPVLVPRRKKITKVHAEFLSSMNAQNSSFPPLLVILWYSDLYGSETHL